MLWTILNVTHLWHFLLSLYEKSIHLILFGAEKMDFGMKFYIYGIVLSLYNTQRIMIKFFQCGCKNCIRICIIKYFAVWETHNGVITHLKPDILECEVRWALGSITTNKASGGDGIPVEISNSKRYLWWIHFDIWQNQYNIVKLKNKIKDDAVKVLHSICQQIWKTQQWPQDQKRSVFIPMPNKGNAKECSTTEQLHSSHMLAK